MKRIMVGNKVTDTISKLVGISLTRCVYLNGCIQHEVQPLADKDNNMGDTIWIDEKQLGGDMYLENTGLIELGSEVECWKTNFKGIVVAYAIHLSGLEEYEVQPLVNDGKFSKSKWIDEYRLNDLAEYDEDDSSSKSKPSGRRRGSSGGGHRNHP